MDLNYLLFIGSDRSIPKRRRFWGLYKSKNLKKKLILPLFLKKNFKNSLFSLKALSLRPSSSFVRHRRQPSLAAAHGGRKFKKWLSNGAGGGGWQR
ncbi:hypothetical protein V6Z11_A03G011700 [Gossypium hirsutum]